MRRSANDDAYGHPGFGYVVSHTTANGNSPLGKGNPPTAVATTVFAGGHHAIHRVELVYDRDREGGGQGIKIPVVIEWLVATGRDHPVWAVTWRTGAAVNPLNVSFDAYRMDTRGPYGSLNFDGAPDRGQGDAIGGVAWGDSGFRFTTTDAELTLNSPWTYDVPNAVNFTRAWTETVNAEMGIVQTMPGDVQMGYPDRVVGRERGSRSDQNFLEKGDCTGVGDPRKYVMPCVNGWPYQLMNFDWDPSSGKPPAEATGTKLMAWGSPYGWLGASSFDRFDFAGTADGRGDRSYATFIALGPKCRRSGPGTPCDQEGDVARVIAEVGALAAARIGNVSPGSLVAQAPRGPGAADLKSLVSGYNDTFAAYELRMDANPGGLHLHPRRRPAGGLAHLRPPGLHGDEPDARHHDRRRADLGELRRPGLGRVRLHRHGHERPLGDAELHGLRARRHLRVGPLSGGPPRGCRPRPRRLDAAAGDIVFGLAGTGTAYHPRAPGPPERDDRPGREVPWRRCGSAQVSRPQGALRARRAADPRAGAGDGADQGAGLRHLPQRLRYRRRARSRASSTRASRATRWPE